MRRDPWNSDVKLPWKTIKEVWDRYWDQDKPLLIEKSPPHIIRTTEIMEHFNPVYFLLMVRNPYAHCEGLIRRNKWDAKKAAEFSVWCLRHQANNANNLKNVLRLTYEELTGNPASIAQRIQSFIPQIGELKHTQKFSVHSIEGVAEREISDFNKKNIRNLAINDLKQINAVLKKNSDIMEYWGYEYYEPTFRHTLEFIKTRSSLWLSTTFFKFSGLVNKTNSSSSK